MSLPAIVTSAAPLVNPPAPLFAVGSLVKTHTCNTTYDRLSGRVVRVYVADALHSQPAYDVMVDAYKRPVNFDECELTAQAAR